MPSDPVPKPRASGRAKGADRVPPPPRTRRAAAAGEGSPPAPPAGPRRRSARVARREGAAPPDTPSVEHRVIEVISLVDSDPEADEEQGSASAVAPAVLPSPGGASGSASGSGAGRSVRTTRTPRRSTAVSARASSRSAAVVSSSAAAPPWDPLEAYAALVDVPMFEAEMGEMAAWRAMAAIEGPPTKSLEASAPRAHPKPPTIPPSGNAAPRPSTARTLKPAASESETDYEPAQVMGRPSTAGARLA